MADGGDHRSPYALGAPALIELGYSAVPIMPGEKRPGEVRNGRWQGMGDWQRFGRRQPTAIELRIWDRYPDANLGLIMGTSAGHDEDGVVLHVIAVDVDVADYDELRDLLGGLPASPMRKRGAKGQTWFYRAPASIKSKPYGRAKDKVRLVDLLTGFDTRQTVCPPSMHPSGVAYEWLAGPVAAELLPVFDEAARDKLEEALFALGWDPDAERAPPHKTAAPIVIDEDDFWSETKAAALSNLDAWVPGLDLHDCRRARGGYEAVATWRASSTGRPTHERKRNLSIQPNGIKDFGTNDTYSAIDLVMAARGCAEPEATGWLRERLGLVVETIFDASSLNARPAAPESPPAPEAHELPDALTRCPGLLGELVDWIADSSRRPQRGLALGAAITLVGTAAGRKYAGPTRSGTQLYVLGLARTSAGKDHALQQIKRLLVTCAMSAHLGPSQFMSFQAVIKRLGRSPLILCPMDEFGSFLARINSRNGQAQERAISAVMREAWASSFQTMTPPEWAGHDMDPIHSPCMSIYGVSTPDEFYAALSGMDVNNGFLNRFMIISTRKRPSEREPKLDPFIVPEVIKFQLQRIYGSGSALINATAHNGMSEAPMISATWDTPDAAKVYSELGRHIEGRERDIAFLARTAEIAVRLATIRAVGVRADAPRITVQDIEWGRDVALWSAERMMNETSDYMSETQNQADAQRIVRILKDRGRTQHVDLVRAMQHRMKARDLKELISALVEAGSVVEERVPTPGGGPLMRFYSST